MPDFPIDIVVPWVDGNDPAWRAERSQYRPDQNSDGGDSRYREWGLFQYWFRSIEMYAPWVRKVHLITWGHLPAWLNTDHPKLNIVNHKDYMPADYLPTFSSHVLELNMHRIPDLAEHFIYFNDDVYLTAPTKPEDFFVNGLPNDAAVMNLVSIVDNFSFMPYIELNMLGNLNMTFSKRAVIKKNLGKWFSPKYGMSALKNLYLFPGSYFYGFRNYHTCQPYCKKTLQEVWEAYPEALERTCHNRFRSREDVNQYLFRYWRLLRGEFNPSKPNSVYLTLGQDSTETVDSYLGNAKYKVVCVNDDPMGCDFETERQKAVAVFEKHYPTVSQYEK